MYNNQSNLNSATATYPTLQADIYCQDWRKTSSQLELISLQNCPNALVGGSAGRRANQRAYALDIEDLQKIRGQVLGTHTHDA